MRVTGSDGFTVEEREMLDGAMALLLRHLDDLGHGRRFWVSRQRVELVCARCGEVVFEGPDFEDAQPGFDRFVHTPKRHKGRSGRGWRR